MKLRLDFEALFEFAPETLHYQFEVILMLFKYVGLNSLSPNNNESKCFCNLCYSIFSFIVLVPGSH